MSRSSVAFGGAAIQRLSWRVEPVAEVAQPRPAMTSEAAALASETSR